MRVPEPGLGNTPYAESPGKNVGKAGQPFFQILPLRYPDNVYVATLFPFSVVLSGKEGK